MSRWPSHWQPVALATGIVGRHDQSGLKSVVEYSSCLRCAFDDSRLCGYQRISSRISEEGLEQPLFNRHQGCELKPASDKTHNQSEVGLRPGQALPELRPPFERHSRMRLWCFRLKGLAGRGQMSGSATTTIATRPIHGTHSAPTSD